MSYCVIYDEYREGYVSEPHPFSHEIDFVLESSLEMAKHFSEHDAIHFIEKYGYPEDWVIIELESGE